MGTDKTDAPCSKCGGAGMTVHSEAGRTVEIFCTTCDGTGKQS